MKRLFKFIFIFSIITCNLQAFARSLEWQKVSLESEVREKVNDALDNILLSNQFFVDVKVKYIKPDVPEFEDTDQIKTKVSDIEFDQSKGDYIAFSKIGLEVPVLEKYYDENQNKLKELFQYNQINDLFNQLESIKVKVLLSSELDPTIVQKSQQLIENIDLSYGEQKAKVEFQVIDISSIVKKKPEDEKKEGKGAGGADGEKIKEIQDKKFNLLEWISKFGNAIGLVLAVLLLGLFSWLILKKYFDLKKELMEMENAKDEEQAKVDEAETEEEKTDEEDEQQLIQTKEDFGRFKQFMQDYPDDTNIMIKRWIGESDVNDRYQLILRAIIQQLEDSEIHTIIKSLNDNEKAKWKAHLDHFLDKDELVEANKTLSEEVVREIVSPNVSGDAILTDMLINLKEDQAIKFISDHPAEVKVLLNLLSPVFSAKVLNKIDEDLTARAIEESMNYAPQFDKDGVNRFKKRLSAFLKENPDKPFNQKIVEMLQTFNPAKEKILYRFLAKEGKKSEIIMAGCRQFPADLIIDLSVDTITDIMQLYPIDNKVSLLLSLEKLKGDKLLQKFAPEGSKAREVLNLEFNSIISNDLKKRQIERNKEKYWIDFVKFTRDHLNSNANYNNEIKDLVTNWAEILMDPDYEDDDFLEEEHVG